ncbi:MAG: AAA family ATPase [Clostridium sp.]|uniref:AAA family ATPase n=1 Tax=Clostridium sp. TaxID=1506 RepID=UPI003D6CCD9E
MNKTLIIIAGMPATGKTTFANYLSDKMQVPLVCKDKLKEIIWDKVHYDTNIRTECQKYGGLAYDLSFHFCEMLMKTNQTFILESNFTNPCPDILNSKVSKYKYRVITVLFDGDVAVIHRRFLARDTTEERHQGLVSINYFSDFEFFKKVTKSCRDFDYGDIRIIVDSTDFSKVSYDDIIAKIL